MKRFTSGWLVIFLSASAFAQEPVEPQRQKILHQLESSRISVDFQALPLEDALSYIRDVTGINIVLDNEVRSRSPEELAVTLQVKDLLLKSVLKLMLNLKGLTALYEEGVLKVVPKGKINKSVTTQIYDVRDLLFKIRDFPGPKVELTSSGQSGTPLSGATFTLDEEPKSTITEDFLTEMIQQNTGGDSWSENASVTLSNGLLIITQSGRVHQEVKRLLQLLRQYK